MTDAAMLAHIESMESELHALRLESASAAALILAFRRGAETYPPEEMTPAVRKWWAVFYEAVRDSNAGLRLLAELAELRAKQ